MGNEQARERDTLMIHHLGWWESTRTLATFSCAARPSLEHSAPTNQSVRIPLSHPLAQPNPRIPPSMLAPARIGLTHEPFFPCDFCRCLSPEPTPTLIVSRDMHITTTVTMLYHINMAKTVCLSAKACYFN